MYREYALRCFIAAPLDHTPMFREELVLVTPTSVRALGQLAAIQNLQTIVFRKGCSYRQRLEAFLASQGILMSLPLEFGSVDAIVGCIAAGVGISMLPRGLVTQACRDGRVSIHELPPKDAMVQTQFIRRRDTYVSSAMSEFLKLARNEGDTLLQAAE